MSVTITRRQFVIAAGALGTTLALGGVASCALSDGHPPVETPSVGYGRDNVMGKRVLVGYATSDGSTVGIAEAIGETLGARGFAADVRPMKEGPPLASYDAVVLGSAIHGGQWLQEAYGFLETNREALGRVPVSLFCVHAMNCGTDEGETARRLAYLDKARAVVKPVAEGFFAGVGPTEANSNGFTRWLFRLFGGDIEGDGRDWAVIRAWGEHVATQPAG